MSTEEVGHEFPLPIAGSGSEDVILFVEKVGFEVSPGFIHSGD